MLYVEQYPNGNVSRKTWYLNGYKHRDNDLPAEITYYPNNQEERLMWYINGKQARINDNPTCIMYHINGTVKYYAWCNNGVLHRDNGLPAMRCYDKHGNIISEVYYVNGKEMPIEYIKQMMYCTIERPIMSCVKQKCLFDPNVVSIITSYVIQDRL